jgi:SET domain-containing protein
VGLWPTASLFNHSCAPNCAFEHVVEGEGGGEGVLRMTAVAPVAEGEELFISYLADTGKPTECRRRQLFRYVGNIGQIGRQRLR